MQIKCPACNEELPMLVEARQPLLCRCNSCKTVLFSFSSASHYLGYDLIRRNQDLIELGLSGPGPNCTECGKPFTLTRPWASYARQEEYGVLDAAPVAGRSPRVANAQMGYCKPCERFILGDWIIRELQIFMRAPPSRDSADVEVDSIQEEDGFHSFFRIFLPPRIEGIEERSGAPVATIAIAAMCILLNYVVSVKGDWILQEWAFYPTYPLLHAGLNWITSLFLHADRDHLLANLFVFFPVSWSLEGHLGPKRFFNLFLFSGFLGHLGHLLWADAAIPSIGASGAIAGTMTCMMMNFPRARFVKYVSDFGSPIGEMFGLSAPFMKLSVPVPLWVGGWGFLQVDGMVSKSDSPINYAAHVGGALGGILFWLLFRQRDENEAP
jgi:membrane associated rhomboid family serine protease